jgi:putative oxidoreductase
MEALLARIGPLSHALVRIVAGFLFACHGAQNVFGVLGGFGGNAGETAPLFTLLWFGGLVELIGGTLVALGVRTNIAAFLCSGQMAVAYFMFHQPKGTLPIQNGGELAALYAFVFLFLAAKGAGPLALERSSLR